VLTRESKSPTYAPRCVDGWRCLHGCRLVAVAVARCRGIEVSKRELHMSADGMTSVNLHKSYLQTSYGVDRRWIQYSNNYSTVYFQADTTMPPHDLR